MQNVYHEDLFWGFYAFIDRIVDWQETGKRQQISMPGLEGQQAPQKLLLCLHVVVFLPVGMGVFRQLKISVMHIKQGSMVLWLLLWCGVIY